MTCKVLFRPLYLAKGCGMLIFKETKALPKLIQIIIKSLLARNAYFDLPHNLSTFFSSVFCCVCSSFYLLYSVSVIDFKNIRKIYVYIVILCTYGHCMYISIFKSVYVCVCTYIHTHA